MKTNTTYRAPRGRAILAVTAILCGACDDLGAPESAPRVEFRDSPCEQEHVESYYDENGEEIICGGHTWEPGWPEDPPPDPPEPDFCSMYPDFCNPPDDPPPYDPSGGGGDGGGGEEEPTCVEAASDIPPDFQQQVNQRVEDCFKNWTGEPFVEKTDTANYSPGNGVLYGIADWVADAVFACIQNFDWLFYGGTTGSQIMQGLVTRLNQQAAAQNLTPHQRICSAMCVSGRLIKYGESNLLNMLPSNAAGSGAGVCREFAQIGERLLDGMGFSSSTVGSFAERHAFVEVTSPEGGTYYVEPQPGQCVFYNRH